ncbi:MAG: divalent cation transporter, partial [Nitrosarchaeum sp.]|nr:divalent cation transporter [Nitrosarchaeum sp.]
MVLDKTYKLKTIASGLIPFVFVVLMLMYILGPGSTILDLGTPLPEVTIEMVEFVDSEIQATVRNT